VSLDVREDLRNGRHPFAKIMQAVSALEPDQEFCLLAPFEPAPLYSVLAGHGLTASPRQLESGDWEIRFLRPPRESGPVKATESAAERAATRVASAKAKKAAAAPVVEVDARGLEPPEPLVKVLETLAGLPAGAALRAHTDRRPMHLYSHLEQRGLRWESTEQPDGSFITFAQPAH
jgi:uncharacterized protein (DUF2249 family)